MTANRNTGAGGGRNYTAEERAHAVQRVRAGHSVTTVSNELNAPEKLVRRWVQRAGAASSGGAGRTAISRSTPHATTPAAAPNGAGTLPRPETSVQVEPGRSARRHWRLVAGVVALFATVATVAGLVRAPTYHAQARLVVGKTVQLSNLASIPGLAAAGQQLASDYSRLVSTEAVQNDAARRLGRGKGDLGGSLTASPVPQSHFVRVETHASSPRWAVKIADAGAVALVNEVNELNIQQTKAGESLLQQYRQADEQLLQDQKTLQDLQEQARTASPQARRPIEDQILAAQTAVDADKVRLNALADDYAGSYSPSQLDEQIIQRVGSGESTGNDRSRKLQLFLVVAVIAGLVLGVGLATVRDLRPQLLAKRRAA